MTGQKKSVVASLGNGLAVAVGPWKPLVASADRKAPIGGQAEIGLVGGEPPTELVILPAGAWELEDITLVTDEVSLMTVLEDVQTRQLDIVFDYHHQSLYAAQAGYQAPASGWLPWRSIAITTAGLKCATRWTPKGDGYLRAGEYRYFSPVVLYDEQSLRVVALLSVALTNTPRTNKQPPLTAEIAASIFDKRRIAASMEGPMEKWIQILADFLGSMWCYDAKELLAHIDTARAKFAEVMKESLSAPELAAAKAALPDNATILQALVASGRVKLPTQLAASADVIPEDVLSILNLPKETTRVQLKAHLIGLSTSTVPRADFEKKEKELAAAVKTNAELNGKNKVDQLMASYADRWTPADEATIRKFAASDFDATELLLKGRQPIVATTSQAKNTPTNEVELPAASTRTVVIAGETRVATEEGADIQTVVNAILAEKGWGQDKYNDANELRKERERVATK